MSNSKRDYYDKIAEMLLSNYKNMFNCNDYVKGSSLSERQNRIIVKNIGEEFSKVNVLFCTKFLIFSPYFIATQESIYDYGFEKDSYEDHVLNFKDIKGIEYSLMPLHTKIWIKTINNQKKLIYDACSHIGGNTYSDVKQYEKSVKNGSYKDNALWILMCIYALSAFSCCEQGECESKYSEIEDNIKKLMKCRESNSNDSSFYGDFFSFSFVNCIYNSKTVERALERIDEIKAEYKAEAQSEAMENLQNYMEREMERNKNR